MTDTDSIISEDKVQPDAEQPAVREGVPKAVIKPRMPGDKPSVPPYSLHIDDICGDALEDVLAKCLESCYEPKLLSAREFRTMLMERISYRVDVANTWLENAHGKGCQKIRWSSSNRIPAKLVARLMTLLYDIAALKDPSGSYMPAVREMNPDENGDARPGIYRVDADEIKSIALECGAEPKQLDDVMECLLSSSELSGAAPRRVIDQNTHHTPMGNGVFDYEEQELIPYTEDMTYIAKTPLCFRELDEPHDGDLSPTKILHDLFPDPDVYELAWDLICASLRPFETWKKTVFLYGTGSNGKSTFLKLLQNLVGEGNFSILSLEEFDTPEHLFQLVGKMLNTGMDNDGPFLERMRILKLISTGEPVLVRTLYKMAFSYTFRGLNIQALNEFPRVKEKTHAVMRRMLILPFDAVFADDSSNENALKIQEFIQREDVLEWVAYHALFERTKTRGKFYDLTGTAATERMAQEYQKANDVVVEFWHDEVVPFAQLPFYPYEFLYDWFREWARARGVQAKNVPSQKSLTERLRTIVAASSDPQWVDSRKVIDHWMVRPAPASKQYAKVRTDMTGSFDQKHFHDKWFAANAHDWVFKGISDNKRQMRGLLCKPVADWCEAHKTKPLDFILSHSTCPIFDLPCEEVGRFTAAVLDGTISDDIEFSKRTDAD